MDLVRVEAERQRARAAPPPPPTFLSQKRPPPSSRLRRHRSRQQKRTRQRSRRLPSRCCSPPCVCGVKEKRKRKRNRKRKEVSEGGGRKKPKKGEKRKKGRTRLTSCSSCCIPTLRRSRPSSRCPTRGACARPCGGSLVGVFCGEVGEEREKRDQTRSKGERGEWCWPEKKEREADAPSMEGSIRKGSCAWRKLLYLPLQSHQDTLKGSTEVGAGDWSEARQRRRKKKEGLCPSFAFLRTTKPFPRQFSKTSHLPQLRRRRPPRRGRAPRGPAS